MWAWLKNSIHFVHLKNNKMKKMQTFWFSKIDFFSANWYGKMKKCLPIERIDITQKKLLHKLNLTICLENEIMLIIHYRSILRWSSSPAFFMSSLNSSCVKSNTLVPLTSTTKSRFFTPASYATELKITYSIKITFE